MNEALKKRLEKLEAEAIPIITPEGQEIIDLLHVMEPYIEDPEWFPPEDPVETERMLADFLQSPEARAAIARKMEAKGSVIH